MTASPNPSPALSDDLVQAMTDWRHDFHQHPELGFHENQTADKIAYLLESFGLQVTRGVGQTGVVGVLQRGNGAGSIGLRADMDALPIQETTGLPYASGNDGVMHACGHDGHTAMLLGAARHLAERGRFNGRAVFIFQPNEEHGEGAQAMLQDGFLQRFDVQDVFAMHNIPGMPIGNFATRPGSMTASESLFEIRINAKGGHAAMPHMGADAITIGSQIVNALQTIVSRKLDPGLNGVVSVTEFETDGARNVLPGHAILRGDARALSPEINAAIETHMRQIVSGICAAHDVQASVIYDTIFPATINAASTTKAVGAALMAMGDRVRVDLACPPKLFSEDFAHFAAARPGSFILIGNGCEGASARPLHSADYDFNDDALPVGADFWVRLVETHLPETGPKQAL